MKKNLRKKSPTFGQEKGNETHVFYRENTCPPKTQLREVCLQRNDRLAEPHVKFYKKKTPLIHQGNMRKGGILETFKSGVVYRDCPSPCVTIDRYQPMEERRKDERD